jgi:uncharacterized protein with NRDE domain
MCLLLVAYRFHADYPLVIAANRDEFFQRPTAAVSYWPEQPTVLAGRDLAQGGTWMGININGRFAALTNVRDPKSFRGSAKSRGLIVADFLTGRESADQFLARLTHERDNYNGFNLLIGETGALHYFSSMSGTNTVLAPGIHGLSNDRLDTPWPKVVRGKQGLAKVLGQQHGDLDNSLFTLLSDTTVAPDHDLPDTGIGLARERDLSPIFIRSEGYGTRCSTLLLAHRDDTIRYVERTHKVGTQLADQRSYTIVATNSAPN